VLQTNEFQRAGILIRPEPGRVSCYWAVIDPSRFRMQIWGKRSPSMDYTSEATALNAALVTNGPYFNHSSAKGGFVKYLAMGYLGECQTVAGRAALAKNVLADMQNFFDSKVIQNWTGRSFGTVSRWESEGTRAMWRALGAQCFSNRVTSDLVGERIGRVAAYCPPRSSFCTFGRGPGNGFSSYVIAPGRMSGLIESISNLPPAVLNYAPVAVPGYNDRATTYCFWGLAPLNDPVMTANGLVPASQAYVKAAGNTPSGLLFVMAIQGGAPLPVIASIRVKDAVQTDTSDSVVFGSGGRLMVGGSMPGYKQAANTYGLAVFPAR
jgi:hypothetical protein